MASVTQLGSFPNISSPMEIKDKGVTGLIPIQRILSKLPVFSSVFSAIQQNQKATKIPLASSLAPSQPTYDVYEACRDMDEARLIKVLSEGANPNLHPADSCSPLIDVVYERNEKMVRLLLRAKADPNLKGKPFGEAAIFTACETNSTAEIFRLLMAHGADPFQQSQNKSFVCSLAEWTDQKGGLLGLRICTGTEGIAVFDSCKDVHDFFSVLFPPFKDALPLNWESMIASLPKSEKLERLNQKVDDFKKEIPSINYVLLSSSETWNPKQPSSDIDSLCKHLQKCHPLYDLVWKEADNPKLLELDRMPSIGGRRPGGIYYSDEHTILIDSNLSNFDKLDILAFETLHAVQREVISHINSNNLAREESVVAREYSEWQSYALRAKLFRTIDNGFPDFWKIVNKEGHAEAFRRSWDNIAAVKYWSENQELMRKKILALDQTKASVELLESKEFKSTD